MAVPALNAPPVGIVAALVAEARCVAPGIAAGAGPVRLSPEAAIIVSGVGPRRAARAADALLEAGAAALVSFGTAAGLGPTRPGDLHLPRTAIAADGSEIELDARWGEALRSRLAPRREVHVGTVAEATAVLGSVREKQGLAAATGAAIADMESAAVAARAAARGRPALAVRAVADDVATSLPVAVRSGVHPEDGRAAPGAVLAALVRRPWELGATIRVALAFRAALAALSTVLAHGGADLGWASCHESSRESSHES